MDNVTGFFGKIPASGDFVARGLQTGLKPILDRWLTRHLAAFARRPELWPVSGLRGHWSPTGTLTLALLILPSQDAASREFPLVFCADAQGADQKSVDVWADAVLTCIDLSLSADQIAATVKETVRPALSSTLAAVPLFWTQDKTASTIDELIRL